MKPNVYDTITAKIIERLESGVIPWRKPWNSNVNNQLPKNILTKKDYRGVNVLLLNSTGYDSNLWGTFQQIASLGGNVKKGEKGTIGVFWKILENEKKNSEGKVENSKIPLLKTFYLFNYSQCEGLTVQNSEKEKETKSVNPIESCESVIGGFCGGLPNVLHGKDSAYYNPKLDYINLPSRESFKEAAGYYSTYFHEMIHATGHKSRLARKGVTETSYFGSESYSEEELVAEMGASFLCGLASIENSVIDNSAAYIGNWLARLRNDNKLLLKAASQAQKAVDYLTQKPAVFAEGE